MSAAMPDTGVPCCDGRSNVDGQNDNNSNDDNNYNDDNNNNYKSNSDDYSEKSFRSDGSAVDENVSEKWSSSQACRTSDIQSKV
jgi:hypothetical protein